MFFIVIFKKNTILNQIVLFLSLFCFLFHKYKLLDMAPRIDPKKQFWRFPLELYSPSQTLRTDFQYNCNGLDEKTWVYLMSMCGGSFVSTRTPCAVVLRWEITQQGRLWVEVVVQYLSHFGTGGHFLNAFPIKPHADRSSKSERHFNWMRVELSFFGNVSTLRTLLLLHCLFIVLEILFEDISSNKLSWVLSFVIKKRVKRFTFKLKTTFCEDCCSLF